MKISGVHAVPADPLRTYELLQDPVVLARAMPGCNQLDPIGPGEYEMRMKVIISSIQGLFTGRIRVADPAPPTGFRLVVEGSGKVGFMRGEGLLSLSPVNGATEIRYDGEVQLGGVIASVGQRMIDAAAKMVIRKFFESFAAEAGRNGANSGTA